MSVRILSKNVEVGINNCEVSCKWIYDEHTRGAKWDMGKGAYKYISKFKKRIPVKTR